MTQRSLGVKLVATLVIASLQALMLPAAVADTGASVRGTILSAGEQAPLEGAKLHLGDPKTGEIYSSAPADAEGAFEVNGVPAATYEMAVESDGGLYMVQTPLTLAPGQTQSVNLAVNPQTAPPPGEEEKQKKRGGTGVWNNPAIAALIVVGAAVVIGLLIDAATDDNEGPASPSN